MASCQDCHDIADCMTNIGNFSNSLASMSDTLPSNQAVPQKRQLECDTGAEQVQEDELPLDQMQPPSKGQKVSKFSKRATARGRGAIIATMATYLGGESTAAAVPGTPSARLGSDDQVTPHTTSKRTPEDRLIEQQTKFDAKLAEARRKHEEKAPLQEQKKNRKRSEAARRSYT